MSRKKQFGFTLLEMLVIIAVIGITISFVTISLGGNNRELVLKNNAESLYSSMRLASEEALMTSKPLAVYIDATVDNGEQRYALHWFFYQEGEWQPLQQHPVLQARRLPLGTNLSLTLDGVSIDLFEKDRLKARETLLEAAASSEKKKRSALDPDAEAKPDIFFLTSGETSTFELQLADEDALNQFYRVEGNAVGQLRLLRPGDDDAV